MKSISSFRDLEQFGIISLTGEADHLGFRILCDLTEEGKKIVEECYGVQVYQRNWNSRGIASCMIPYWGIKELAIIGCFLRGYKSIMTEEDTIFYLEEGDEFIQAEGVWNDEDCTWTETLPQRYKLADEDEAYPWPSCYGKVRRIFEGSSHAHRGTRNVHAMSGRAV